MTPSAPTRTPRPPATAGFWLFALHLWSVFALAISNGLMGLAGLAALAPRNRVAVDWARIRGVLLPLGLYCFWLVVSAAASLEPGRSLAELREVLTLGTLLLALFLVRGEARVKRLVDGLIAVGALLSAFGLAQLLFGFGDIEQRIRGPFSHYMTFAGVLLIVDFFLVGRMAADFRRVTAWNWLALILINLALLGSLTRSAWVAFGVTLTLLLALRAPRLLLGYLPAAALFLLLAPVPVVQRVGSIADLRDLSNYDRLCMVDAGLKMIAEKPLFGLGPGVVKSRYPIYRHPTAPRRDRPHLHNSLLQIAAAKGIPALAIYLWLMGGALVRSLRGFRRDQRQERSRAGLYLGAALALVAFHLAGFFEDNWADTEVQRLALFAASVPYCLGASRDDGVDEGEPEEAAGEAR